ncbi:MAG: hypothetical protein AAB857_01415 [Patescibacteria group bacterium]
MADDQKPKTMDINDLVRELSKSSTSPMAPTTPPPVPQASRPSFPTPPSMGSGPSAKLPMSPPMASPVPVPFMPKPTVPATPVPPPVTPPPLKPLETPRPQFNVPSKLVPPSAGGPVPTAPPPTPGVKEYQSSIRTMNEDISRLKQGQKPTGIDVPRKVEQVVPVPQPPPKPAIPDQQFKVPSVNLGETQKTGPLASSRDISKAPLAPKAEPKPQIYVPQEGKGGGNRNMLFIGIGAVAIVAGFAYWFFVLRSPAPEIVIESPTPTPTETPAPTPTPILSSIFSGAQKQAVSIKPTNSLVAFVSDVAGIVVVPGVFKIIEATDAQIPPVSYSFADLVTKLALKVPGELASNFGNDSAMFIYGQKESFDSKGNLQVGVTAPNRIVIIAELKSPSGASLAAINWEVSLSSDLKTLFSLGTANKNQPGFLDNSYRGASIRYRNFPYADKTIDYAIVSAFNGKTYFVVADSKEAIFAVIDKLVNF